MFFDDDFVAPSNSENCTIAPCDLSNSMLADEISDCPTGCFRFANIEDLLEEARGRLRNDPTYYPVSSEAVWMFLLENKFSIYKINWIKEICERLILMPGTK